MFIAVGFMMSCSSGVKYTREQNYGKMYEASPNVVVVMPPINKAVNVDAKESYYSSANVPLCEAGYYVLSPYLMMEMFKSESAYDSEMFINSTNFDKFRTALGADALLFTVINKWEKSKIGGYVSVDVDYILKSAVNGEVLFQRKGDLTLNTTVNTGGGGLLGTALSMIATAVSTNDIAQFKAAKNCNFFILSDIPRGKYDVINYHKDQKINAQSPNIECNISN